MTIRDPYNLHLLLPAGVLRQGQGKVGELPVGDRLPATGEAANYGSGLAAEQLYDDGLVALEIVLPVPLGSAHVGAVRVVLFRHRTWPGDL